MPPRSEPRFGLPSRFAWSVLLALPLGAGAEFVTAILSTSPHEVFRHFTDHDAVDAGSYDLLEAAVAGAIAVLLALTVATLAATAATPSDLAGERGKQIKRVADTWWWIWPSTSLTFAVAALASTALGFPRYWWSVPVQAIMGLPAYAAFIVLNGRGVRLVVGSSPRSEPETGGASTTTPAPRDPPGDTAVELDGAPALVRAAPSQLVRQPSGRAGIGAVTVAALVGVLIGARRKRS